MSVLIETSLGDIVIDLFVDKCPRTTNNFLQHCKNKYYNGCLFHNIHKDFIAQTGDPTGTGTGGRSVYEDRFFVDEIRADLKHDKVGTVGMASAGRDLNASQFYITLRDNLDYLDEKHTIFGEVAEGLETLTRINQAVVDEENRPRQQIIIKQTYVLYPPELADDSIPEGEPKDELEPPLNEQLSSEKEAHSRAVALECIGDIPDADVKPPDNVLFVCQLNPVTEDEDLHVIFSQFGTVVSAEILRDYRTGESLCYAFVEFEKREACEQAYFKMNNALIDDRRICVDLSQSVSKIWKKSYVQNKKAKN